MFNLILLQFIGTKMQVCFLSGSYKQISNDICAERYIRHCYWIGVL